MPLTSSVLFDLPQNEIASLITDRMARSSAISIVTGFATPGGLAAISDPVKAHPQKLKTLVVGAATYPGFETLDTLLTAGVPPDPRAHALMHALCLFALAPTGFRRRDLRDRVAQLQGRRPDTSSAGSMTDDLRRLRLHGLIDRVPKTHRYRITLAGAQIAMFYARLYTRALPAGLLPYTGGVASRPARL
jgi:hypothetical protein